MENTINSENLEGFRTSFGKFMLPFLWVNFVVISALMFASNVYLAEWFTVIGFVAVALPTYLWLKNQATALVRNMTAAAMAILVIMLINAYAGTPYQIDIHMYIFASLALMAGWVDLRAIIVYVAVIAVHHLVLNFLYPLAVFPEGANILRVMFHASVLIVQAGFLVWFIQRLTASISEAGEAVQEAGEAQKNAEALSLEREQSGVESTKRQDQIEELIKAFQVNIVSSLDNVTNNSANMQKIASDLTGMSTDAKDQVSLASGASDEASQNVNTVAVAAEELSSSISEITRQVEETATIVQKASDKAEQTNEQVISLSEKSQRIGAVVSLIQDIAEQTNLLALNATIEAARAGEMGKGFAVVASEVKNLANQTAKATEEISGQVTDIQASTKEAVDGIQEITQIMANVDEFTTTIGTSVSQQNDATLEISENVAQASNGTQGVANNMSNITATMDRTKESATNASQASEQMDVQIESLKSEINDFLKSVAVA